jgi:hypothetical protein
MTAFPKISPAAAMLGALVIPQQGASFCTLSGEGTTVASIFLAPGRGLTESQRRCAEAHPIVSCHIRADLETGQPGLSPLAFHRATLRWAISNAARIGLWSAPFPEGTEEMRAWAIKAYGDGVRFTTVIETAPGATPEWKRLVEKYKRNAATVTCFWGRLS